MASRQLNVLKTPLSLFSTSPMTGFYRDGYCRSDAYDPGNHSVAAILTAPFLAFSASRGNDLRTIGLTAGCKWCLCAGRWREAMLAAERGDQGLRSEDVPRIVLEATGERAVVGTGVAVEDLRRYAVEGDTGRPMVNGVGRAEH